MALAWDLYSKVWWAEHLPRALAVKDGQSDRTSFQHAFGDTKLVWRWAKDNSGYARQMRERRRGECLSLPDLQRKYALSAGATTKELRQWDPRALDRLSCSVTSEPIVYGHFSCSPPSRSIYATCEIAVAHARSYLHAHIVTLAVLEQGLFRTEHASTDNNIAISSKG